MAAYGLSQAGFVVKPLSAILSDLQQSAWGLFGTQLDLSAQTPDGQFLGIVASEVAGQWELAQVVYNQDNPQDAEGAALDNIGDLRGLPRETASYSVVSCTCTFSGTSGTPFAIGALVANVAGQPGQTYSNQYPLTVSSTTMTGVLFKATNIGEQPAVNDGTLTAITTPVSSPVSWLSINNPGPDSQTQLGTNAELDSPYMVRQVEEMASTGSCNPTATAAAIVAVGAAQSPPQTLIVSVPENTSNVTAVVNGITLPPHTYAVIVWDEVGAPNGWASSTAGQAAIGQAIWNNKPTGNSPVATVGLGTAYFPTITDPFLGLQGVAYTVPSQVPLYITMFVVPRPTFTGTFASLQTAIIAALEAAAVAGTPANGEPPPGQLAPGSPIIGSQLQGIVASVPGVLDVYGTVSTPGSPIKFGTAPAPSNTAPIVLAAYQVGQIVGGNITITQASGY